jgi:putative membrane protein
LLIALILRSMIVGMSAIGVILLLPGITIERLSWSVLIVGWLALANAAVKPILTRFSIGCSILALGPILLIFNTLALCFISAADLGFQIDNFWAAFWGGLVISVVSFVTFLWISDGS